MNAQNASRSKGHDCSTSTRGKFNCNFKSYLYKKKKKSFLNSKHTGINTYNNVNQFENN